MAQKNFPPDSIKELLGELTIAIDRSTAPENKISLTSSRISKLLGILKYKCKNEMQQGLRGELYKSVMEILLAMRTDRKNTDLQYCIEQLYNHFYHLNVQAIETKQKMLTEESLELLCDYNVMLQCRERWKVANDTYTKNNKAWSVSNKMLADMNDVMTDIEMRYDLVIKPKNMGYNITDIGIFGNGSEK